MKKIFTVLLAVSAVAFCAMVQAATYDVTFDANSWYSTKGNVNYDRQSIMNITPVSTHQVWAGYIVPDSLWVCGELNVIIETELSGGMEIIKSVTFKDDGSGNNSVIYLTDDKDWQVGDPDPVFNHDNTFMGLTLTAGEFYDNLDSPTKALGGKLAGFGSFDMFLSNGTFAQNANFGSVPNGGDNLSSAAFLAEAKQYGDILAAEITLPFAFTDWMNNTYAGAFNGIAKLRDLEGGEGVPEPSTIVMLLTGMAGLGIMGYRRRNQKSAK